MHIASCGRRLGGGCSMSFYCLFRGHGGGGNKCHGPESSVRQFRAAIERSNGTTMVRVTGAECSQPLPQHWLSAVRQDGLHFDLDVDLLRYQDAACIKGDVPGQIPVFAVDRRGGGECCLLVAPWVGSEADEVEVQ